MERVFQMGLFEEVGAKNVQVKEKRGGGTRHLKDLKTATMGQLMEIGKELFFPNGKSKIGNVNDFEFQIRDFTEDELDPLTTLGEQYEKRKVFDHSIAKVPHFAVPSNSCFKRMI